MDPRPVPVRSQPLLGTLPVAARRASGVILLTVTLWLASLLALFQ